MPTIKTQPLRRFSNPIRTVEAPWESGLHRWTPKEMLGVFERRSLLSQAREKLSLVKQSLPYFESFPSRSKLVNALQGMVRRLRMAELYAHSNHYQFLRQITFFYERYEIIVEAVYRQALKE